MTFIDTALEKGTIQLDSFKLLSHPDTKLICHLNMVAKRAIEKVADLPLSPQFRELLFLTAIAHDFGKGSRYFQKMLKTGKKRPPLTNHGLISALFGYFITRDPFSFLAIRYHHLNLADYDEWTNISRTEVRPLLKIAEALDPELERIYSLFGVKFKLEEFKAYLKELFRDGWGAVIEPEEKRAEQFWEFLTLFSTLIDSDKEMAIFKKGVELPPLQFDPTWVEKYKKRAISIKYPLDEVREQIYRKVTNLPAEELEEGEIFLMELPTGAGKTLALIKLALSLRKEKIFYLLPFITLIEQNAQIFREVLKEGGVDVEDNRYFFEKHSLGGGFQTKEEEYDLEKREFIGDNFNSRVIVTTFHQFFYSFFKSRNSLLKRAINVQNSVVVIDEIQAVKEDLFPLIESLLQFLVKRFNCKVIIATATLPPLQFDPSIKVVKLPKVDEILSSPQLAHFNRYEMDFSLPLLDENSILKLVEDKLKEGRDQLFRVNTINSANYLAKKIEGAVLLTSAIPPILRRRRIAQIKKEGGVVVATQVIQAGVDVSLKDGFEELAPLDLLVQSMGRRNRSGEKGKGFANVIRFNFKGFDGSRVYNQGLIKRTLRVVDQVGKVEEKEVHSLLDLYYRSMGREVSLLEKMENYMFKTLDRKFNLFEDSITLSFFTVLDEKSEELWEKLAELEERRQNLSLGRNFWQEKRQIEEEFDRIKKEVFLYTCNVRLFNPREDIAKVESYFDKALFLYRVDEEFFDPLTGVNIRQFLKEEDITW